MKTETAIIKLVQITSREKADGTYNIVLRVQFNGRKERYLNVSCPIKYWDGKNECIKKGYANAEALNAILMEAKRKAEDKKVQFELNSLPYTASMLLDDSVGIKKDLCGNSIVFVELIKRIEDERKLKYNTMKNYKLTIDKINEYTNGKADKMILTEIDEKFVIGFCKWMKENIGNRNSVEGTINCVCSKIAAVWNFAIANSLVDSNLYCFKRWKYNQVYKQNEVKKAIYKDDMQELTNYFINKFLIVDAAQGLFTYTVKAWNNLQLRHTEEFALAIYLIGYRLQGLALTDLANIKVDNVSIMKHNKEEYYAFSNIRRNKTNEPVPILVKKDETGMALLEVFLQTADKRDGYLFPMLQNNNHEYNYDTEDRKAVAMDTAGQLVNKRLKSLVKKMNEEFGTTINPKLTFYSMRHSFATAFINNGGDPYQLAEMMGRSPQNIFRYVKNLTTVEDIINARNKVFE